jgi:hypothetical protein
LRVVLDTASRIALPVRALVHRVASRDGIGTLLALREQDPGRRLLPGATHAVRELPPV